MRRALIALAIVCAPTACGDAAPDVVEVAIDGGAEGVALLGEHRPAAGPGDVLRIRHASPREEGAEAPTTHALVAAPADALPALFLSGAGGAAPNAAVWGPCRGGEADAALAACPVAPVDAPEAWDGRGYWSTGALLPGEEVDVPLAADLATGAQLVCAIHPELVVRVDRGSGDGAVGEPAATPVTAATPGAVDEATESALAEAEAARPPAGTVLAGVPLPGALVQRFSPSSIEIRAGESVTWVAAGAAPIDVVFGDEHVSLSHTDPADALRRAPARGWDGTGSVRSGYLSGRGAAWSEERFRLTFTAPGTYRYTSRFSDAAAGEVVVSP